MSVEEKYFWLGKGTLGKIRTNQEIPKDYISKEDFDAFVKKGLIGTKVGIFKPSTDTSELKQKIEELETALANSKTEKENLSSKVNELTSKLEKAEEQVTKLTAKKGGK